MKYNLDYQIWNKGYRFLGPTPYPISLRPTRLAAGMAKTRMRQALKFASPFMESVNNDAMKLSVFGTTDKLVGGKTFGSNISQIIRYKLSATGKKRLEVLRKSRNPLCGD